MKKTILVCGLLALMGSAALAQEDKSKRASPPASARLVTDDGVTIDIQYSSPALKGRKIGTDLAPFGEVWRTGANEATTIEVDRDVIVQVDKGVVVESKNLPAGKYSLHTIPGERRTVLIFNKVWDKSGSQYDEKEDALRLTADNAIGKTGGERMKFDISPLGQVTLSWGSYAVSFTIRTAK